MVIKKKYHDWCLHRSLTLMLVVVVLLVIAFQSSAKTVLFSDYFSGMLTGLSVTPLYEGRIVTQSLRGAGAAMQELSKYSVKVELLDEDGLKVIKVYASSKNKLLDATKNAAEAADHVGDLVSFSIVKQ